MATSHSFNTEHAARYGLAEAVIINHLSRWIHDSAVRRQNFHEGRYWTSLNVAAFRATCPYLTIKQIRRALDSLETQGVILKRKFRSLPLDQTLSYAFMEPLEKWT